MKIQLHNSDCIRDIAVLRILYSDWLGGVWAKTQQKELSPYIVFVMKNHTREEGGVHHRISVSHLLMSLKNNFLLKKLLKWANKKYVLIFTKINKNN